MTEDRLTPTPKGPAVIPTAEEIRQWETEYLDSGVPAGDVPEEVNGPPGGWAASPLPTPVVEELGTGILPLSPEMLAARKNVDDFVRKHREWMDSEAARHCGLSTHGGGTENRMKDASWKWIGPCLWLAALATVAGVALERHQQLAESRASQRKSVMEFEKAQQTTRAEIFKLLEDLATARGAGELSAREEIRQAMQMADLQQEAESLRDRHNAELSKLRGNLTAARTEVEQLQTALANAGKVYEQVKTQANANYVAYTEAVRALPPRKSYADELEEIAERRAREDAEELARRNDPFRNLPEGWRRAYRNPYDLPLPIRIQVEHINR
jgi:hypothetical protein